MGHADAAFGVTQFLALGAAGALARPSIANAQAKTAELWWVQVFVPEEDVAIKKIAPITGRPAAYGRSQHHPVRADAPESSRR